MARQRRSRAPSCSGPVTAWQGPLARCARSPPACTGTPLPGQPGATVANNSPIARSRSDTKAQADARTLSLRRFVSWRLGVGATKPQRFLLTRHRRRRAAQILGSIRQCSGRFRSELAADFVKLRLPPPLREPDCSKRSVQPDASHPIAPPWLTRTLALHALVYFPLSPPLHGDFHCAPYLRRCHAKVRLSVSRIAIPSDRDCQRRIRDGWMISLIWLYRASAATYRAFDARRALPRASANGVRGADLLSMYMPGASVAVSGTALRRDAPRFLVGVPRITPLTKGCEGDRCPACALRTSLQSTMR